MCLLPALNGIAADTGYCLSYGGDIGKFITEYKEPAASGYKALWHAVQKRRIERGQSKSRKSKNGTAEERSARKTVAEHERDEA
jgi:hypothetical protein